MLIGLVACGGNAESKKIYKAAYEKQQEVLSQIKDIRQQIASDTTELKENIEHELHELEEGLFEIPGYHLELPGHEGHDHSHDHSRVELTPEEILAVQDELLEELKGIKSKLNNDQ